jgi:hypothetical protein
MGAACIVGNRFAFEPVIWLLAAALAKPSRGRKPAIEAAQGKWRVRCGHAVIPFFSKMG